MTTATRRMMLRSVRKMADIASIPVDLLVPQYLIHCAAYYQLNFNIITDQEFDRLARRLYKEWDKVHHRHKNLIDRNGLSAGGSHINLPLIAVNVARSFQWALEGEKEKTSYVHASEKKVVKPQIDTNFFKRRKESKIDTNFFKRRK